MYSEINLHKNKIILIGFIGSIIDIILYIPTYQKMKNLGYDIIQFELFPELMPTILDKWASIHDELINFHYVDMTFPIFYSMLLTGLVLRTSSNYDDSNYHRIINFGITAMVCDIIENIFILLILFSYPDYNKTFPYIMAIFAWTKFLFIFILIGNIIINLIKNKN